MQPRRALVVAVLSALAVPVIAAEETQRLQEVVVTGAREEQPKAQTPATIHTLSGEAIRDTAPTHPSQAMNQLPGVWVNITGGEGHQTAIRHPLTTNPVYLYLEDGVPTRSTGFFNHNALYEINVPQSSGIEVIKGPGTVLHGSDAIGGVINVLTRKPPLAPEADVSLEAGEYGFRRLLASGGTTRGMSGYRIDLNHTQTDGWRDATDYDRNSFTLRHDRAHESGAVTRTIVSYSRIDQNTAGSSALSRADYESDPTINYTPISFREVTAVRLSTSYERERGDTLWSITPYARYDDMDILPNWSLSYDPTVYNTRNGSIGVLAKYRRDFDERRARLVAGIDVDHSPGSRLEHSIVATRVGSIYTDYTLGAVRYDYDVAFQSVSPYVHGEYTVAKDVRVSAGLRYDTMRYDYENHLGELATGNWKRPASTVLDYNHLSPKLGVTWALSAQQSVFAAWSNGFRAPSESQLFRQGSALNTIGLEPVKVDNLEIGWRKHSVEGVSAELSLYHMTKKDDILSFRNPVTGLTEAVNAGETLHRGVEAGVGVPLPAHLRLEAGWSYGKHTYEEWVVSGTAVYSGNEMETAPRTIGSTRLHYSPPALRGGKLTLEWVKLGTYWEDAANTQKYEGHDLVHLRARYPASRTIELFGQIFNLTDERFAESASYTVTRGEELSPGMPRTLYVGVRYHWQP